MEIHSVGNILLANLGIRRGLEGVEIVAEKRRAILRRRAETQQRPKSKAMNHAVPLPAIGLKSEGFDIVAPGNRDTHVPSALLPRDAFVFCKSLGPPACEMNLASPSPALARHCQCTRSTCTSY